jgi:hypothetical protein
MSTCARRLAIPFALVALAACGSSSKNSGGPTTTAASSNSTTASTTARSTTSGAPQFLKDPCILLTAADAKGLLAMDYAPTANKTSSPFLSCAYTNNSGSEALTLAVSTNSLASAKIGVDGAKDLSGLGDAAFVASGGRNAVVAWTSGAVAYKLSWNTLTTATRTAAADPLVALAHAIAART